MSQSTWRAIIVVTGFFTALVHLVYLNIGIIEEYGRPDLLFTLNGLGYLALLAGYFWKTSWLEKRRGLVRWAFIAFTAVTIVAWIAVGERQGVVPYLTKLSEIVLIVALWMDGRAAVRTEAG